MTGLAGPAIMAFVSRHSEANTICRTLARPLSSGHARSIE